MCTKLPAKFAPVFEKNALPKIVLDKKDDVRSKLQAQLKAINKVDRLGKVRLRVFEFSNQRQKFEI